MERVHTLYSDMLKTTVLVFRHNTVSDGYNDDDGCLRILYIADGNGRIAYDGREESFCSGDVFVFDNKRQFRISCDLDVEICLLKFNLSNFVNAEYLVFKKDEMNRFLSRIESSGEKLTGIHVNTKKIQDAIFMIENEFENKNDISHFVIRAYVFLILALIMQYLFDELDGGGVDRSYYYKSVKKAILYIEEHLSEKMTLDELAEIADMGKTNFSIAFKNVTGMTAWEYILNARIDFAASCLVERNGDLNITEVAMMSGFENAAHFTKVFKKIKGSTPRDFKKSSNNPCF